MFDLGMSELLVIGVVALIIIGPKDLPIMFRSFGKFTAKLRAMAREFSRAMESAADEAGVKDVAKDLRDVTSAKSMGLDAVRDAADRFEKWDPLKEAKKASAPTASPSGFKAADAAAKAGEAAAASATDAGEAAKPQLKAVLRSDLKAAPSPTDATDSPKAEQ